MNLLKDLIFYCYFRIRFRSIVRGLPIIRLSPHGKIRCGKKVIINSSYHSNPIGSLPKTIIIVKSKGILEIGDYTGISNACIYCENNIFIGKNVFIGGGVKIYDTDFHSIVSKDRKIGHQYNVKTRAIVVEDDVFIGGHSIILKGVKIGKNSVIGAGSVVTKNIPENEIWAGNPVRFIGKVIEDNVK